MKKILLGLLIGSILAPLVYAENAYKVTNTPDRVVIIKHEGEYLVSGESSGSAYVEKQKVHINKLADDRIEALGIGGEDFQQKSLTINTERFQALDQLNLKGQYADLAIQYMKQGMSSGEAKEKAASEIFVSDVEAINSQTGYNEGSVSSTMAAGDGGSISSNSDFKQFNELDCSYSDVSNYIDKSLDSRTKAFATSPSYSKTYKATATKATVALKGAEEAACQTIFHDLSSEDLDPLSVIKNMSGIPNFDSFGDILDDLGNKAGEKLNTLADSLYGELRKGLCSRMSMEYLGGLTGDLIGHEYSSDTKGTALDGTRMDKLDTESGQNNFTYKIIKNQSELSNSDLIKAIDVTRDDQNKYQERHAEKELDKKLNDLEKDIFGG